ncbi:MULTISPECIES: ATP-binding cassette domain-containing protein [unclassified Sporosarcina]|uniref:ATP-binding cassette domain-containing protein n=1 Tax=unclassified Sporosarcina TaxID=2647733 RepID=UPI00204197D1|nr:MULTISPECIES: ATP-binding cassette domain-containing protein [unclassified Sporosarcina]GKV67092.1 ABC transporter ATP-binding protein [Sporosarcina sp. NCCP-2331]GLB57433.1 ABC transporter ATP-binding protein [Sporosarcina sp. NCCP-2378]
MSVVMETRNVGKNIGGLRLFENISFVCTKETVLFVQGSNGTGKSTLLKILAGIYEPTDGKVIMNAKKIGYVPEHFPEGVHFKVKEYLTLIASFHSAENENKDLLAKYIHLFGLSPFLTTSLIACSKGTKQKVGIIQALLLQPELLILDEPLTGLDLESQEALITVLAEIRGDIPIIFTAHDGGPITQIATDVLHIESGEMVSRQRKLKNKRSIRVQFLAKKDLDFIQPGYIQFEGNQAVITVSQDTSDDLLIKLLHANCSILEVKEIL